MEGKDAVSKAGLRDRTGHSPHGTRGLILGEYSRALFAEDAAAGESVGSHTGKDDRQNTCAVDRGSRAKEDVDGGTAVVFECALGEVEKGRRAGASCGQHLHVPVSARYGYDAGANGLALGSLAHWKVADLVEALGQGPVW